MSLGCVFSFTVHYKAIVIVTVIVHKVVYRCSLFLHLYFTR